MAHAHVHAHVAATVQAGLFTTRSARRAPAVATHEVRFADLFREGVALAFPCDDHGRVDLDGLTDRARNNYLYARAMVGRDFALPVVQPCGLQ